MESPPFPLLHFFLEQRSELRRRLKYRLGSDELVNDALQETYLRIERMGEAARVLSNPAGYLFRMALNVASDQRLLNARYLTGSEVEELLNIGADTLDPARIVQAQFEVETLERALDELTARQRDILIASRVEDVPQNEIAHHFGISVRMVGKELKKALEHCGERLDRKITQRFGPGAGKES
jgi:RNA polymerase sigma-70 factor (ECF subfamily)